MALLGYKDLKEYGVSIVAAFDVDKEKVGTTVADRKIFPLEKFENITQRLRIRIGIITVPGEVAQKTADMMVKSGIRAILNFAPVKLIVPEYVKVQDVNLASYIAILLRSIE